MQIGRSRPRRHEGPLGLSVYENLRSAILKGEYGLRARISELETARRFKVSRTPVREALRRLEQEGLLSRDGPRKLVVTTITPEEVAHIYPIVACLEGLAGSLAIPYLTAADMQRLRTLNERMAAQAAAGDVGQFFSSNGAFHDLYLRRANNPKLYETIGKFRDHTRRFRLFLMKIPGRMALSAAEHEEILEALARRDPVRVEAAIRKHVMSAATALRQTVEAMRLLS